MAEQGFTLTSADFADGGLIPAALTCDGENRPPKLKWIHPPDGTCRFALIADDPDAPQGTFTHWVKFNIPAARNTVEGDNCGESGRNDFQAIGYGGPCPPPNHGTHRYYFRLFALDVDRLDLGENTTGEDVRLAVNGHILEVAELMGRYRRGATSGR